MHKNSKIPRFDPQEKLLVRHFDLLKISGTASKFNITIKTQYMGHERLTCVNISLLFGLALSYDIVYLQSITGYLNKVILAIKEDHYGVRQRLSCQFWVHGYSKCDWRVNYWIPF